MPLLCSSLCVLLFLLPLVTLSCNSKKSPKEIGGDYRATIQTELLSANQSIVNLLQNTSCPDLKRQKLRCTSYSVDVVMTLFNITYKMKNLSLPQTTLLVQSVQHSVHCPWPDKPPKEPRSMGRVPGTKRHGHKKHRLCRAKAFLSAMAQCYELLNTLFMEI